MILPGSARYRGPFFVLSALCVAGFAAAELLARYGLGLGTPPLYEFSADYEYRLIPNQSLYRFGNLFETNQLGLRSPSLASSRPQGQQRVLVVGDSIVWGGAQLDQSMIATELMRAHHNFEVANVSAPSWGPANQLAFLQTHGLQNASHVVLVISSHDAFDVPTFKPLAQSPDKPTSNPPSAFLEGVNRYLLPRLLAAIGQTPAPDASLEASTHTALQELRQMLDLFQHASLTIRAVQFWDKDEIATGTPQPGHAAIKAVLAEYNIQPIQSGPVFQSCAPLAELFTDSIHPYTPAGQACLADTIMLALQ